MVWAFAIFVTLGIPVIAWVNSRRPMQAYKYSVVTGVGLLWAWMVFQESRASDSDFDIVFAFACLLWGAVLAIIHAACFGILGFITLVNRRYVSKD